ncbi:MAG: pyruvate:ferredoxin (flavodoxin) oxidoreductase [Leptolyngbya sp. PLA3]|nr:MAG: pyruvate:ferredoxin (flavodoxin) oxidoreductase [Cyanobacteria bacterium CYA]MCE7969368.1 pyruvate:ferredoxin (flavodoxin) oxidoreductase [Leptolyngbya sp. PL-A3]
MSDPMLATVDGNEACASVAYRLSEVIVIYPITPSSPMGEFADEWSVKKKVNLWGQVPSVTEMQSEGGAAGAIHGALQGGALATTFTASQGLLLMIPNMYKIAGELTPFVMHVTARTLATHALSIFGDHSDVMACRQTGFAMLAAASVQEAQDMACIATASTLKSRVPFMHFFDGFRTSHEVSKIRLLSDEDLRFMMDDALVGEHRRRALTPDHPVVRGTAQNPDTFFQAREACNIYYDACAGIVTEMMKRFGQRTGRTYRPFDYFGAPDAERVIVIMGSGVETASETAAHLVKRGEKVGVVAVRLYRPFSSEHLMSVLPRSVRMIAVMDRTKEPGAIGDPLYLDVLTAITEAHVAGKAPFEKLPRVIAGRYGLSSKEFTPAMVKGIFEELSKASPKPHFTVGFVDDVTKLSITYDESFQIEGDDVVRAVFFGLGADGTVGANKNSIKIIGEETENYAQGYFVYDSKKSGARTVSHLRFGPREIRAPYLIRQASFVACHQFNFLDKVDVLKFAAPGATFLLNAPYSVDRVWDELPREVQEEILARKLKVFTIDAAAVAEKAGMGNRLNAVMQTCFFALSGVLPREQAIAKVKEAIKKTYGRKGDEVVRRNCEAVDMTLDHLFEVKVPGRLTATRTRPPVVSEAAPDLVKKVTAMMLEDRGDLLPVSAFPVDGTWPTGTTKWEKRNIASEIPIWEPDLCIQCNKCAMVCPHAAIRAKIYDVGVTGHAPASFKTAEYKAKDFKGMQYVIQVAPEDCTGCNLCVNVCPAKDKSNPRRKAINMASHLEHKGREKVNFEYFLELPEFDRSKLARFDVKGVQVLLPLFEYSGACSGCGETPYVKLITQLFGDRTIIANATGCSSIYGGNLPTTPYTKDRHGRGPAWCNSLFEDNAEFGLGIRLAVDAHANEARRLVAQLGGELGDEIARTLLEARQVDDTGIELQRLAVKRLREKLAGMKSPAALRLSEIADYLVKKSVWLIGGDGWAFDIGYGGLDHVLSLERNVNIIVLDTEVYSNTGGQASKATPLGASAKFAVSGKAVDKKDLGLMAMSYGHVYVASIAMGANDNHTVKAITEAESYDGPSLIIAYSHCIAHGYDMQYGLDQQKRAVDSGIWPLYRYDPRRVEAGEPPLVMDARGDKIPVKEYLRNETRFRMVERMNPERFHRLADASQAAAERRVAVYQHMAALRMPVHTPAAQEPQGEPVAEGSEA